MKTVMTHNNGYDTVLLVCDDGTVISEWQATRKVIEDYVRDGAQADLWDEQTDGIEIDGRPAEVEDYGEVVGENGAITAERREFWLR